MATIDRTKIDTITKQIIGKVREIQPKNPQIMQLVKAHCIAVYGRALQQINAEPDAESEKQVTELLEILNSGDYKKLNAKAPAGQAIATPPPTEVQPPVNRLNPAQDEPEVPTTPAIEIAVPVATTPILPPPPLPAPMEPVTPQQMNGKEGDLVAAIVGLITKHASKGGVTEDRVRQIVREELAKVFSLTAGALKPGS